MLAQFPQTIGDSYLINKLLDSGGMGDVYQGIDTRTQTAVAIKVLRQDLLDNGHNWLSRFRQEGEALRALEHPNIVKMLEAFQEEDKYYIVMEFINGGSLADRLQQDGPLPIDEIVEISLQLADALTRSHYLDIIHRDLKPANLLMDDSGRVCLADFGVAHLRRSQLTQAGSLMGTLDYLSPEIVQGQEATRLTDIWSFGVTQFEMLTGRLPFSRDSLSTTLSAILSETPPDLEHLRPDAPPALVDLIYRILQKDPAHRPPSIRLVGAELEAIQRDIKMGGKPVLSPAAVAAVSQSRFETPVSDEPIRRRVKLPDDVTNFIGREREKEEITNLLRNPSCRLVSVVGPSGMGKTRLAIEAVKEIAEEFANGVAFVALAPLTTPESVYPAIWEAVGYPPKKGPPKPQTLDYFKEKEMVLIFDSFEDRMETVELVDELLKTAPGVQMVATSTERLNLRGETVYRLESMTYPAKAKEMSEDNPLEMSAYDAVRLFADCATRWCPGFKLDEGTLPDVIGICQMVQGLPLALMLAASWVNTLPVDAICQEIAENLDILETELRDVPDRQRSIRAVFEHTWERLSEGEQDAFARLAVFRGGFDREAAQAITGANVRALMALANKSLLWREPGSGRYLMHRLLRRYAEEELGHRGELEELLQKHAAYYSDLAEMFERKTGEPNETIWYQKIRQEGDNFNAALHWALVEGNDPVLGGRIFAALGLKWFMFDDFVEGLNWVERSLHYADALPSNLYGKVLARASLMCCMRSDYVKAAEYSNASVDILRKDQDPTELVYALTCKANFNNMIGQREIAYQAAEECLNIGYRSEEPRTLAWALSVAATYAQQKGQQEKADQYLQEMFQISQWYPNRHLAKGVAARKGWLARQAGDFEASLDHFRQALAIEHEFGLVVEEIATLASVAYGHYLKGDTEQALVLYASGAARSQELTHNTAMFSHLIGLGVIAYLNGENREAERHFREMLRLGQAPISVLILALGMTGKVGWDSDKRGLGLKIIAAADAVNQEHRGGRPLVFFDKEWREVLEEVASGTDDPRWEDGRSLTFAEARDLALKQPAHY